MHRSPAADPLPAPALAPVPIPLAPPPAPTPVAARERILRVARAHFFTHGFHTITMDDLARELGMSKKTLYRHFPTKEAVLDTILDRFAEEAAQLLETIRGDVSASTTDRLRRVVEGIARHIAPVQPAFLVSLKRFAPAQWDRLDQLRRRNLERHLLPMLVEGQARGEIRASASPRFVLEFLLVALPALLDPATLGRLDFAPAEVASQALDILFRGLVQPVPASLP